MENTKYLGKLKITPKMEGIEPFEIEGYFCKKKIDGEVYFYTGKTKDCAASSFPEEIVEVIEAEQL